ncbi:hypothetical protein C8R45DRAFT_1037202 [Mycena sanguinolenta]|nr:hypothetical protein C8R45DRAFT_1037202 [Mycena sanguinolenta]
MQNGATKATRNGKEKNRPRRKSANLAQLCSTLRGHSGCKCAVKAAAKASVLYDNRDPPKCPTWQSVIHVAVMIVDWEKALASSCSTSSLSSTASCSSEASKWTTRRRLAGQLRGFSFSFEFPLRLRGRRSALRNRATQSTALEHVFQARELGGGRLLPHLVQL